MCRASDTLSGFFVNAIDRATSAEFAESTVSTRQKAIVDTKFASNRALGRLSLTRTLKNHKYHED
ncbi:hypothetical protein CKA32_005286 [Geitlerinema sp. FC II]|nr:hypothetical protein CKA32_005286 [Geitlerinema sp. FC II]